MKSSLGDSSLQFLVSIRQEVFSSSSNNFQEDTGMRYRESLYSVPEEIKRANWDNFGKNCFHIRDSYKYNKVTKNLEQCDLPIQAGDSLRKFS